MIERVFAAVLVCSCSTSGAAVDGGAKGGARALAVDHVDDLGAFSAPSTVVGRDGTSSALVGGALVWTFGDTFLTKANAQDHTSVRSSTAGWSTLPPWPSLALAEPLDDAGLPMQLVPYTPAELLQNTTDASNGYALWPGPTVATDTTGDTIVFFEHVIRQNGSGFHVDAIGTAHVALNATQAARDPAFLFQSPEPLFGNGGATVDGGNVHLFNCEMGGFLDFQCKVARAPIASATMRGAYTFWNGTSWVGDVTQAAPFIDHASYVLSVEMNPWLGRWVAIYTKPLSNDVGLRAADALTGPWTDPEVVVPGSTSGIVTSDAGLNYLAKEHVALRSLDGRQIVISYAHPLSNFGGACRLARLVLK
jgi:hypothetical protein